MESSFSKHVRNALNHLYDLDYLRHSPLISAFRIQNRFDAATTLQRLLIDSIENLRPGIGELPLSEKRKIYEILYFRYIQQFKQEEVAHHIGVSERQFRREQDHALDVLATLLQTKYSQEGLPESPKAREAAPASMKNSDWDWIKSAHAERVSNLKTFISEIQNMMQPVAAHYRASIRVRCASSLPELSAHPVAARQILLNLVQAAIYHGVDGKVVVSVEADGSFVEFGIWAEPSSPGPFSHEEKRGGREGKGGEDLRKKEQEDNLIKVAAYLAQLSGGRVSIEGGAAGFACRCILPAVNGITVVAIDDNHDILDLLERYTAGTRYHLVRSSQSESVIDLAIQVRAHIIVLDVMMPKMDGWELLGRIRSHPQTANIPVIVLTILDQEELALSLGAQALVLKPVTQDPFLAALDAAAGSRETFVDRS